MTVSEIDHYLEKRGFHITQAKGIEDKTNDIDRNNRKEALGNLEIELGYLNLSGYSSGEMEKENSNEKLK